ncbi:uncharacterized protein LOC141628396 [Silene latifolia]|uniref:uncharacterized protein LOC141628396 n=1 Tax=Silene latifolia TaxID=37657 RepID=UPI003D789E44
MTNGDGTIINTSSTKTIDVLSPYYLGSHDVPSLSITHVLLRSDNYEEWSRSVKQSLKSRRKYGFVDGSIKQPTDEFLLDQWVVVNCTLVQWLMRSIDSSIKHSISYFEEARLLWDDLAERFSSVDGAKIHGLKARLHDCIQTKGMSVTDYFGQLKTLWDDIAAHEPVFACTCGNCTCEITKNALARQDSERLHKFLMGLDLSIYANIRSHILALDPLPPLNRASQMVLQEERLRTGATVAPAAPTEVMAYALRPPPVPATTVVSDWKVS